MTDIIELSEEEYKILLNEYLNERKDTQPSNFFGAWSWYTVTKGEFDKQLKSVGIVVRS